MNQYFDGLQRFQANKVALSYGVQLVDLLTKKPIAKIVQDETKTTYTQDDCILDVALGEKELS